MRRFTDPDGRAWDVVLGRASFGALLALFVPAAGNTEGPRQAHLSASSHAEAAEALEGLTDEELTELFNRSNPKDE